MMPKRAASVHVDEHSLTIDRVYDATPERLFRAWTDPALVCRWLAPGPHMTCRVPTYDAREGGAFRIEMTGAGPDGIERTMVYEGTFDEVVPGERIAMTWTAASEPPTVVTVTLTPVPGGTRLRLSHKGLPGVEWAKRASAGWETALETLASLL